MCPVLGVNTNAQGILHVDSDLPLICGDDFRMKNRANHEQIMATHAVIHIFQ